MFHATPLFLGWRATYYFNLTRLALRGRAKLERKLGIRETTLSLSKNTRFRMYHRRAHQRARARVNVDSAAGQFGRGTALAPDPAALFRADTTATADLTPPYDYYRGTISDPAGGASAPLSYSLLRNDLARQNIVLHNHMLKTLALLEPLSFRALVEVSGSGIPPPPSPITESNVCRTTIHNNNKEMNNNNDSYIQFPLPGEETPRTGECYKGDFDDMNNTHYQTTVRNAAANGTREERNDYISFYLEGEGGVPAEAYLGADRMGRQLRQMDQGDGAVPTSPHLLYKTTPSPAADRELRESLAIMLRDASRYSPALLAAAPQEAKAVLAKTGEHPAPGSSTEQQYLQRWAEAWQEFRSIDKTRRMSVQST